MSTSDGPGRGTSGTGGTPVQSRRTRRGQTELESRHDRPPGEDGRTMRVRNRRLVTKRTKRRLEWE